MSVKASEMDNANSRTIMRFSEHALCASHKYKGRLKLRL